MVFQFEVVDSTSCFPKECDMTFLADSVLMQIHVLFSGMKRHRNVTGLLLINAKHFVENVTRGCHPLNLFIHFIRITKNLINKHPSSTKKGWSRKIVDSHLVIETRVEVLPQWFSVW